MSKSFINHVKDAYGDAIANQVREEADRSSKPAVTILARILARNQECKRAKGGPFNSVTLPMGFDAKKRRLP
jgi:hypothetical protein